jgi:hypothetical protein
MTYAGIGRLKAVDTIGSCGGMLITENCGSESSNTFIFPY